MTAPVLCDTEIEANNLANKTFFMKEKIMSFVLPF